MGIVKAICISEKKGTQKHRVEEAVFVEDWGIEKDAHAGKWHRQVSLLSYDKIEDFKKRGAEIMGECIMPKEGIFAKVIQGGTIRTGDELTIIGERNRFRTAVLTLSDKGAVGEREDKSGPLIREIIEQDNYLVIDQRILPDEQKTIEETLIHLCDRLKVDLILTTGGTGFSLRDRTPEATLAVSDRLAPGISEAIRAYSMQITNRAMLSRGVSVLRGQTLIINLPGSPKAVKESLDCILPALGHGLEILKGSASEVRRAALTPWRASISTPVFPSVFTVQTA